MPIVDFWIIFRWWGTLFFVGAAAFPITSALFSGSSDGDASQNDTGWYDRGYFFSKSIGIACTTWIVFILGMSHTAPFTIATSIIAVGVVFGVGILLSLKSGGKRKSWGRITLLIIAEEIVFFCALLFWSWIKAHEPSIRGLEKFMDYGFMNAMLHSRYFPPMDMWYPPLPINYYYFGHLVSAVLTRLSGIQLSYTFNLMLSTIFALCLTMSFSIGFQLSAISHQSSDRLKAAGGRLKSVFGGILTAFLVTLAGNMQTIYAFTKGYSGDEVRPFWKLLWPVSEFITTYSEGFDRYWYANATRFIPYTIHEFPSYSFVVSDIHGHVLSIPFVLLALALLIVFFGKKNFGTSLLDAWPALAFYGFVCGILLMTNALDGPIYFGLFFILFFVLYPGDVRRRAYWVRLGKRIGIVLGTAGFISLPFVLHFASFVHGVAINCPPEFLANSHIGPIIFEGVEKCQKSPLWMMWLLWGFFWFHGIWFLGAKVFSQKHMIGKRTTWQYVQYIWNNGYTQIEKVLLICFFFSMLLIIFPEFFYFKDIYPQHFRSNTMFKLGYQAFMLFSVISAYVMTQIVFLGKKAVKGAVRDSRCGAWGRKLFIVLALPQLFLVSIYPYFSVRGYFGQLKSYEGIWGLGWLAREHPDNFAAIEWLNNQTAGFGSSQMRGEALVQKPVIVEADGDSYTDYNQFSVFTGMPTVVGWAVHEWLWRGGYDAVSPRRDDVRTIYESTDADETGRLLRRYAVRYIIVGTLEREKFKAVDEKKFMMHGRKVFESNSTVIYEWNN